MCRDANYEPTRRPLVTPGVRKLTRSLVKRQSTERVHYDKGSIYEPRTCPLIDVARCTFART
jgi:hypothetical protein